MSKIEKITMEQFFDRFVAVEDEPQVVANHAKITCERAEFKGEITFDNPYYYNNETRATTKELMIDRFAACLKLFGHYPVTMEFAYSDDTYTFWHNWKEYSVVIRDEFGIKDFVVIKE